MLLVLRVLSKWTQIAPTKPAPKEPTNDFRLVKQETHFDTSDQVKRFLPDILGRALARCWIDRGTNGSLTETKTPKTLKKTGITRHNNGLSAVTDL